MPLRRREFLGRSAALFSVGFMGPELMTAMARAEASPTRPADPILVVVQLTGGNDGLNTVIPYTDPLYYSNRPTLAIARDKVLPVSSTYGLHPSLGGLKSLYEAGKLGILPGAGYPSPNRSHFRSMEIWQTANPDKIIAEGWLGRYLDSMTPPSPNPLFTMNVAQALPKTFASDHSSVPSIPNVATYNYLTDPKQPADAAPLVQAFSKINSHLPIDRPYVGLIQKGLDDAYQTMEQIQATKSYQPSVTYPADAFGQALELVAQVIVQKLGTRIFYVQLGGFDTHARQASDHEELLGQLGDGLAAFYTDIKHAGRADDLLVVTFSEFGRRVAENGSAGTDHGAAGTMFVLGGRVRGGFHGGIPSLANLENGDLKYTVDFRSVYATILQTWLGSDPAAILGSPYPLVDFV
jgi:uncharacterized protein (DUF1501 family)